MLRFSLPTRAPLRLQENFPYKEKLPSGSSRRGGQVPGAEEGTLSHRMRSDPHPIISSREGLRERAESLSASFNPV